MIFLSDIVGLLPQLTAWLSFFRPRGWNLIAAERRD
jgi:hypothetical protein